MVVHTVHTVADTIHLQEVDTIQLVLNYLHATDQSMIIVVPIMQPVMVHWRQTTVTIVNDFVDCVAQMQLMIISTAHLGHFLIALLLSGQRPFNIGVKQSAQIVVVDKSLWKMFR